jgi:FAD/FMN-containing dehydrogenase/Fe-S oxidoreductase
VPTTTPAASAETAAELTHLLRAAVRGEVDSSSRARAQYTSDASNYRVVPRVVVYPLDVDDLLAVTEVTRATGVPLTMRGAGTSVAGNAIGPGIVVDTTRHLTAIGAIDPEARTAVVAPGVVMTSLQAAAEPFGLRFGPDPSTQNRATFGGMIGNNACGPRAVAYGRTVDNVVSLDVVDGAGRRFTATRGDGALDVVPGLETLVNGNLPLLRTELGRFSRQVSGYSLEHLLPEKGTDLAKMLVGTEGTLVTILSATVSLVDIPDAAVLVVLGYPDMPSAADAVPALLAHGPLAVEGLDARLVDVVRRHQGDARIPALPAGAGWLMVEMGGATRDEALARAKAMVADAGTSSAQVIPPGADASAMWQIRADGAGLAGRAPDGSPAWPGWEDAAVPPERLGGYLREFDALMASHGVDGLTFGHFGDGCVHVRIGIPLNGPGDVPLFRDFITDAARLVAAHGGSLSGEHGDGRARSELLPLMYSPEALAAFAGVKHLFDPGNLLNPGVLVAPAPLDADLRRPHAHPLRAGSGGFAFAHDDGDFSTAVHRCVGVGKCRADTSDDGGFMCPSYLATGQEKDVTRGRARVLQEMANGGLVTGGWRSPELREVLDLCLSCKACSSDCPAGVDMAQYKAEVLHRAYRRRLRPMNHYALGWLPRWTRLISRLHVARVANAFLGIRPLAKVVLGLAGLDRRRTIPEFATTSFRTSWARQRAATHPTQGMGEGAGPARSRATGGTDPVRRVVLWADSFSDAFDPGVPQAMVTLLQRAGYEVIVPAEDACCGLTWVSTGQLDGARKRLVNLLAVLGPFAVNGIPIIGVEPSCTALLRSDLVDLVPNDPRALAVARATRTLAELLTAPAPLGPGASWTPPDLSGLTVIAQPHCHQHSVMGYEADLALLAATGADVQTLAGCCGLAGNFGYERGHYEVSVAVAEHALLPALRAAPPGSVLLADGFSCRTQADQLAGVAGMHLSELLLSGLD